MKRRMIGQATAVGAALLLMTACGSDSGAGGGESKDGAAGGSVIAAGYGGITAPMREAHFDQPFKEDTGIDVKVELVPGQQVAGISAQNQAGKVTWDYTGALSGNDFATLHAQGYLAEMPEELREKFGERIPEVQPFGLPTKRGAVRIVCNAALVDACPTNAEEFFDTERFPGERMLPSFQPEVALTMAFAAQGLDDTEMFEADAATTETNIDAAIELLESVEQDVVMFYSSSSEAMQLMQSGEIVIAGLWDGATYELATNPTDRLELEASWHDAVTYLQWDVVYEGGPNTENAWKYIEWMYDHPENVAEYSAEASSATTDPSAFEQLDAEQAEWLPAPSGERAELAHEVPTLWLSEDADRAEKIQSFWDRYTSS